MENLTPRERNLRSLIRGFLIGATVDEMERELEISRECGDVFRAKVIAEVVQENLAGVLVMENAVVHHDTITREIIRQYGGAACYLNGKPAKVTGMKNRFASISPLNPDLGSVQFAWHTVNRIMRERGGFFES